MMVFTITCPCACGATVEARDAGFSATTVEVDTCAKLRSVGEPGLAPVAVTIAKSLAYSLAVPATTVAHRDGLVAFEGSL